MSIPSYVLFELGFGFKYQYLMSALIHTLITKKINFSQSENYLKKNIKKYSIHGDCTKFITQVQNIIPDVHELKYNINSILMLEGENSCFEDINLFTTNNISQIRFFQVKGSMSDSYASKLNSAVVHTLKSTLAKLTEFQRQEKVIIPEEQVKGSFKLYSELMSQKIALQIELRRLRSVLSEENPQIKYIKEQIRAIDKQLSSIERKGEDMSALPGLEQAPEKMAEFQKVFVK
uniref:hypothetical protein n=1 Tax=Sulfurimonas sp. TaxID=2022749 RepID=UPI002609F27E